MRREEIEKAAKAYTAREIRVVLDRELDKPEEEANNDIIQLCLDIIDAKHRLYELEQEELELSHELRDQMFPDGQPEPEEFIGAIAELVRQLKEL